MAAIISHLGVLVCLPELLAVQVQVVVWLFGVSETPTHVISQMKAKIYMSLFREGRKGEKLL